MEITTIGLDIAKRVFQVHGADAAGKGQLRRKLQRADVLKCFASLPPCLVGIEACGTAHHWAREIRALGHKVRLMPASYMKLYVKRGKTDVADAEAICEAVTRPTMRFVPIKSAEQQAALMLHRTRDLLVRQRTMLVNALRGTWPSWASSHPRVSAGWATSLRYCWARMEVERDLGRQQDRPAECEGGNDVMANRSNPGPGTTRLACCAAQRAKLMGNQAANCIRTSGHNGRINRPDT